MNNKKFKENIFYFSNIFPIKSILKYWENNIVIFCFHRVLPMELISQEDEPNREIVVSTKFFDAFLDIISKEYRLCSLEETIQQISNKSKEKIAHITFDDGYKDNLEYALPILEKYNAPMTLYIATRFPQGDTWMWWYELWDTLLLNDKITVEIEDKEYFYSCKNLNEKNSIFSLLRTQFSNKRLHEQKEILCSITKNSEPISYGNICLNWDEIKQLDQHPLITIGSHTHNHPVLSQETSEALLKELSSSKELLEAKLGHKIEHFAYPFGGVNQFGTREINMLQKVCYTTAVSTICTKMNFKHKFDVPRYFVTEASGLDRLLIRLGGLSNFLGRQFL